MNTNTKQVHLLHRYRGYPDLPFAYVMALSRQVSVIETSAKLFEAVARAGQDETSFSSESVRWGVAAETQATRGIVIMRLLAPPICFRASI